jgi:signal transduction histidine kinase
LRETVPVPDLKVLLIDDSAVDARRVQALVSPDAGFQFTVVPRLQEGLRRLVSEEFDAVLADLSLSGSDGMATLDSLREAAAHVPVVVLSSLDGDAGEGEALAHGAQEFLTKRDLTGELLTRAVRHAVQRTRAQRKLVEAETLRAVGNVAAGMAHHVNNVLAIVDGRLQLLLQHCRTEKPDLVEQLDLVHRAVSYGVEIVRRLQRCTVEGFPSKPAAIDVNALLEDVLELSRPLWQDGPRTRGALIDARLDPGMIPTIRGDALSLRQAFVNLLVNAVEALPTGGRIRIRTWSEGGAVLCAFTDDGVGMTEEIHRRALEPFFTSKGPKTTGLGLSMAHGIVQRHGGELEIESRRPGGTTVLVRLSPHRARGIATASPELQGRIADLAG